MIVGMRGGGGFVANFVVVAEWGDAAWLKCN